jgi:hypothetical protein
MLQLQIPKMWRSAVTIFFRQLSFLLCNEYDKDKYKDKESGGGNECGKESNYSGSRIWY